MSKAELIQLIYGALLVALGAPGFWQYIVSPFIDKHRKKKNPRDMAMIGLLHEDLWDASVYYKNRYKETGKGLSQARYNYLEEYIYGPYRDLGGNADAEEIMKDLHGLIDER